MASDPSVDNAHELGTPAKSPSGLAAGDDTSEEGGTARGHGLRARRASGSAGVEAGGPLANVLPVGAKRGIGEGDEVPHE